MQKQFGAIYVAMGRPYLAMALLSASTLRKTNPEIPIHIVTNVTKKPPKEKFWDPGRDEIALIEAHKDEAFFLKSKIYDWSPYEDTIFLDCDTIVLDDVSTARTFLKHFDIACTLLFSPPKQAADFIIVDGHTVAELPHWNSGVVFFRKGPRTRALFDAWQTRYREFGVTPDQPALAAALFNTDVRLLSLNSDWNGYVQSLHNPPSGKKIYHYMKRVTPEIAKMVIELDHGIDEDLSMTPRSTAAFLRDRSDQMKKRTGPVRHMLNRVLGRSY